MYTYELQQARRAELQRDADQWRLVRQAKAARAAERRARRGAGLSGARPATRTGARADTDGAEGAEAASTAAVPAAGRRLPHPVARLGHAARSHRADHRTAA